MRCNEGRSLGRLAEYICAGTRQLKLAQPSRWLQLRPRPVTPLGQPTGHFPTLLQTFRVVHILKTYSVCLAPASQRTLPVHRGVGLQASIACKQTFISRVSASRSTARNPLHLPASYYVVRTKKKTLLLSSLRVWACCSCRERTSSRGRQ